MIAWTEHCTNRWNSSVTALRTFDGRPPLHGEHGHRSGCEKRIFRWTKKQSPMSKIKQNRPFKVFAADADAEYDETYTIDLAQIQPDRCLHLTCPKIQRPSIRSARWSLTRWSSVPAPTTSGRHTHRCGCVQRQKMHPFVRLHRHSRNSENLCGCDGRRFN